MRCHLLKVAHHGSHTSSTPAFIKATGATHVVINCEPKSSLGHPVPKVLAHLRDANIHWYRTDRNGTIVVSTRGEGDIGVRTQRGGVDDAHKNRVRPLGAARMLVYAMQRGAQTQLELSRWLRRLGANPATGPECSGWVLWIT